MVEHTDATNTDYDELKFSLDTSLAKYLAPNEQILMSTVLYKYNRKAKRQERSILITTKAVYNINKQDLFASFMSVFSSDYKIRRRIDITKLSCITISDLSSEFVLHVPDEYDYRYSSPEKRAMILTMICKAYYLNSGGNPLKFCFIEEVNLTKFTTTKIDRKSGISRIPLRSSTAMDEQAFNAKLLEMLERSEKLKADTETVFLRNSILKTKVTLDDFEMLKVIGRGAYGKVMLVEKKDTKKVYAMKSLHKDTIIGKDQLERIKTERLVLEKCKSPFLVGLEYAFQTPDKIFFIMKFMKGGELFQHLRSCRKFDEKRAKFYAAEIVLALEYLHSLDIVYRDLKPENVLLDEEGHVCLTDFGMAKGLKTGQTTSSFVGTPEYLAPEVIQLKGHAKCVDWWTLGVLICEMLQGAPPFYNKERNMDILFNSILTGDPTFYPNRAKLSLEAKDLICKLLVKDPTLRLGYKGAVEIKTHPWFNDIDWKSIGLKKIAPPFKPKVMNDYDVGNFDEEFTEEEPMNSVVPEGNIAAIGKYQKEFKDFSYVPANETLMRSNK